MITRRRNRSLLLLSLILALSGTASWQTRAFAAPDSLKSRLTGTASYRERIALTERAVFEATLEDVSKADAPVTVIARVRKVNPGQVPISFAIDYDPRRIEAARKYVVRTTITETGRFRFASDQAYPVLTHGHGDQVTIMMRRVPIKDRGVVLERPEPASTLGPLPATFTGLLPCADCAGIRYHINLLPSGHYMQRMTNLREDHDEVRYELGTWSLNGDGRTITLTGAPKGSTYWAVKDPQTLRKLDREGHPIESNLPYELMRSAEVEPIEPRLGLQGMFRYQADAARFRECRTGLEWPVAMTNDYQELERAYTARRAEPGAELLVSLQGRIEQRPKMEGQGTEATLVVEKFVRALPGERCDERATTRPELGNNRWRPVRIGEQTVIMPGQEREPWIVLDPRTKRLTGSGGCNRISGSYKSGNGTLRFGPLVSTKMACPAMEIETEFLRALTNTRRYRIVGRVLELVDDHGRLLAQLEERNLR